MFLTWLHTYTSDRLSVKKKVLSHAVWTLNRVDSSHQEKCAYDIRVFSESWLKAEITDNDISFENFTPPHKTDRADRQGGGVVVYVRDMFHVDGVMT